jgi:hypothetical protein
MAKPFESLADYGPATLYILMEVAGSVPDCRIDYGSNHREGRIRWAESKRLLPVAIPISRFLDPALISLGAALRIALRRCPGYRGFPNDLGVVRLFLGKG